ncbi:MAG: hypothetical protein CVU98_04210 [Firmicutes bacterium HGW-Firmicutes-3]|nr:MAG: hypothetical protein CVU98_04210 [Firmicutes bacterium HGW-Firmicutes-3]
MIDVAGEMRRLGEILIDEGIITERHKVEVLEFQYGIPRYNSIHMKLTKMLPILISTKMARRYILIPII